jgi:serine protease Do
MTAAPTPERSVLTASGPIRPASRRSRLSRSVALLAAFGVAAVACGDADEPAASTTTSTPPTTAVDVAAPRSGAVTSIEQAQGATIQIVAQGSLRDPEFGTYAGVGKGSGFFVSPDGIAVTNQHVVTGAATLEVYIGGDTTKSYNAQILGVSECNDLAVIKVNTPDDVPFMEWYDGEIRAGLDVYAAGFPLGDPEFTLTKGIIAKAKAGGDLTGTSSIDHTIEHDANIQPGNSGGPLLTPDGKVAGVNYAGGAFVTSTEQFYAIASSLAKGVVERLEKGDFESLGVNGWAVYDDSIDLAGVWVAGVEPGSPASKAEVLPGDIILTMNGLPVGQDGTFKDYCDVIRTAATTRPVTVEVLRWDTEQILEGEINGTKKLKPTFSFAQQVEAETDVDDGAAYTSYVSVTDDLGVLTVEVPAAWRDIDTTPDVDEFGNTIPYIAAATSLSGFYGDWTTSGMVFGALSAQEYSVDELLESYSFADACTDAGIFEYDDGAFYGAYQLWDGCGGTDTLYVVLATNPAVGGDYIYLTAVQVVTSADLDALDHIFGTFNASA